MASCEVVAGEGERDCEDGPECGDGDAGEAGGAGAALTAAQRARIERNRLRARALQDARLVRRPPG